MTERLAKNISLILSAISVALALIGVNFAYVIVVVIVTEFFVIASLWRYPSYFNVSEWNLITDYSKLVWPRLFHYPGFTSAFEAVLGRDVKTVFWIALIFITMIATIRETTTYLFLMIALMLVFGLAFSVIRKYRVMK